jgi:hypothetical protein
MTPFGPSAQINSKPAFEKLPCLNKVEKNRPSQAVNTEEKTTYLNFLF